MAPFYYTLLLLTLLYVSGWLFRKSLSTNRVKIFIRIFIGIFALAGAIMWTLLLLALKQFGNAGDGAGTGNHPIPPEAILLEAAAWLVPMTAFTFMLLGAFNVLRGALWQLGYWYALTFLVVAGSVMMILFPQLHYCNVAMKWVGLFCLLVSVLWCYSFCAKVSK